jgi:MFS family permease
MLDLRLFGNRHFSAGIASGIGSYLVMFGVLLLIPFYLARGRALGPARIGVEIVVLPVVFGVVAPMAGRVADRIGARRLTVSGMALVASGLLALGVLRPGTPGLLLFLAVIGGGLGLFTPPNNATIMGSAPPQQAGMASGILNMSRGMGTALGLALTGLLFTVYGGDRGPPAQAAHAFTVTALALAGIAGMAGLVAALAPGGDGTAPREPLSSHPSK